MRPCWCTGAVHQWAGACLCALTALLVSPISWENHWVWIVPTLIAVGTVAWRSRSAVAAAVVVVFCCGVFATRLFWWGVPQQSTKQLHMSMVEQLYAASFAIVALIIAVWLVAASFRFRAACHDLPSADYSADSEVNAS